MAERSSCADLRIHKATRIWRACRRCVAYQTIVRLARGQQALHRTPRMPRAAVHRGVSGATRMLRADAKKVFQAATGPPASPPRLHGTRGGGVTLAVQLQTRRRNACCGGLKQVAAGGAKRGPGQRTAGASAPGHLEAAPGLEARPGVSGRHRREPGPRQKTAQDASTRPPPDSGRAEGGAVWPLELSINLALSCA